MSGPQIKHGLYKAHTYFSNNEADVLPASFDGTAEGAGGSQPLSQPTSGLSNNLKLTNAWSTLGLSGNVISAVAHIPYSIAIDMQGEFEVTPRESQFSKSLAYLSSSTSLEHTIVGWTGQISLATDSATEQDILSSTPDSVGKLGNVTIRDSESAHLKGAFVNHMRDSKPCKQPFSVSKRQRGELETLLENAFLDKISAVWLGDWSETEDDDLILQAQERWHAYSAYIDSDSRSEDSHQALNENAFADYLHMNKAVADAILRIYNPGDIIWVHDCSLMLLPSLLRQKLPSAYICYYHGTESSAVKTAKKIMHDKRLMQGLLGASAIGVSSRELRQEMEDYYQRELNIKMTDNRTLRDGAHEVAMITVPIISNKDSVEQIDIQGEQVQKSKSAIAQRYKGSDLLIVLADQEEPEAVQSLLTGYDQFLNTSASSCSKNTVLVLITGPNPLLSSLASSTNRLELDAKTCQQITTINGIHGTAIYQPLVYIDGTSPPWDYVALMHLADLCIITTNKHSRLYMGVEVALSQKQKQSPLFICSSSPQTSHTFAAADIAQNIERGLQMSDADKKHDHDVLFDYLARRNFKTFTDEFLFGSCKAFSMMPSVKLIPALDLDILLKAYNEQEKRLVMFDFDGTLTPIVNDPDAAIPTKKLLVALSKLVANSKNQVWLISGRSRDFLQKHFGHIAGIGLSAEHGSFIRWPTTTEWENLAESMDMGWKREAEAVFSQLCAEVDLSRIESKEVAMVWHYRNALDHDACLAKAVEAKVLLESERLKGWDVDVMLGKANLEVRPAFLNKGAMATSLIKKIFGRGEQGFLWCAGDDTTDEDMFRAILSSNVNKAGTFACLVSTVDKPSLASYRVSEPYDLVNAVARLSDVGR